MRNKRSRIKHDVDSSSVRYLLKCWGRRCMSQETWVALGGDTHKKSQRTCLLEPLERNSPAQVRRKILCRL